MHDNPNIAATKDLRLQEQKSKSILLLMTIELSAVPWEVIPGHESLDTTTAAMTHNNYVFHLPIRQNMIQTKKLNRSNN